MLIRNATQNDAAVLTKQNILLAKESENMVLDYETVHRGVEALLCDKNKGFYIVAEDEEGVIGQLLVTYEWSDWKNMMIWWIQSVYVQKRCRKKAVCTKLFQYITQLACENHISILRLYVHEQNCIAQAAYTALKMKKQPYVFYQLQTKT